jgi:hypothetical protein
VRKKVAQDAGFRLVVACVLPLKMREINSPRRAKPFARSFV